MNAISIRIGLWMFAGFTAFFLLMYVLGFGHRPEIRVFNIFIQLFCLYRAIKAYYALHPEAIGDYFLGVVQGLRVSVIGVGGFALFMSIFLTMNPELMNTIRQNSSVGEYLHPFTAILFILVEGIAVGAVGSYILMRVLDSTFKKVNKFS